MNKCPAHTCLKKNGSACRINDHASRSPFYCSISKCPVVPVFIHGTTGQHGTDGTRPSRFRKTIKGDFAKNIKRVLYKTMPVSRVATDENSKSPAFHLTIPKQKDCESRDCPKCPEVSHRPNPWKDGTWDSGTRRGSNKNQPTELTLGMVNYSLQKYKGTATRHTCPNCGDRHSFAYYVDDSGVPLHPSVGRCNHESSCGYHYTPKEYFHDRPECRTAKSFSFDKNKTERKTGQASRQTVTGYISPQYVERSQSVHSNFFRFISSLLGSYYGSKAKEVLRRLLEEYRLGATRDGAVIFWQIDRENKVHTGKVMQYNPENGHRIKGGEALAVDWIHSKLKRQRVLPEEWQLSQCLFGEHLLNVYPDKVAVLVESEKSAVIGSAIFPDYVWLAAGGKSQMREEKLRVLAGRTVLLFPDADAYAEWKQRAECMSFCKVIVSDLIEKNATPEQKAAHIDIADWIVFQIRESKIMCTASHLVEAERILGRMIDKNPVLQKLIDELDLVLVGAAPICNGSADPP